MPGTLVNSLHTLSHLVFIPTTLGDNVGAVIIPLVREGPSNLTSEPFHMPLQWWNSACVSLEKKLWPLGWPPTYFLTVRFYDFCESGIKIRKQNCGDQRRKMEKIWVNEWIRVFKVFKLFPVYSSCTSWPVWATDLWLLFKKYTYRVIFCSFLEVGSEVRLGHYDDQGHHDLEKM